MVRVISQETFNDVVKENMEEFSMTPEEAVEDAVKQFEAQGIDLSNILKAVSSNILMQKDMEAMDNTLSNLSNFSSSSYHPKIAKELEHIIEYCEQGIALRMHIASRGFLSLCVTFLTNFSDELEAKIIVFKALAAMITDQPDAFLQNGQSCAITHLTKESDPDLLVIILKLLKLSCIKHEDNRQRLMAMDVVPVLQKVLEEHANTNRVVRGVCSVFRALVLDDDIRHEFGLGHEHARTICEISEATLVELLNVHSKHKDVLGDLLLALSAIVVRNEFCMEVVEASQRDGLTYVLNVFQNFPDSEKLNRTCLKFIKVLAGNDFVKGQLVREGAAPYILASMRTHQTCAALIGSACGCIAALCLRSAANAECFVQHSAPAIILDSMRTHPMDVSVQKQGCWAIRNIVSRSQHLCHFFLDDGAEELLNHILKNLVEECEYDAKSALRDLGCVVTFREEWTGIGGALN